MKIINYLISALLFIICPAILANCPAPETVRYTCDNGHCSWAPYYGWYEGSNPDNYIPKEHAKAASFTAARWVPYSGPLGGATTCYYVDEYGNAITLVQQSKYGQVPKPLKGPWKIDPTNAAQEICTASAETCYFDYGETY
ncbi:MAG TPA: hypothetical protein VHE99_00520 [Gammaproteobacteria bacterium]|nr:hypothetical protein [Gammaproteobacteria bacterium]